MCRKCGHGFFPKKHMFAGAPAANTIFDVGGDISLMTFPASLGSRKNSLGKKKKEDPVQLEIGI